MGLAQPVRDALFGILGRLRALAQKVLTAPGPSVELSLSGLVMLLALASRLAGLESRSIWMDEDAQARRVLAGGLDAGLIERASTQQQPPLDYYFEHIGLRVFGVTPFGARIHAAVLGALTVLVIYAIMRRLFEHRGPALLAALLALLHPELIFYSHEGRPIASGVFFASLYLYALVGCMTTRAGFHGVLAWLVGLTASSAAFLLAVGFQPVVFIVSTAVALLPTLLSRPLRWRAPLMWSTFAIAGYSVFPILQGTIKKSSRYLGSVSPLGRVDDIVAELGNVGLKTWGTPLTELLGHLWPFAAVAGILGIFGLAKALRTSRGEPSNMPALVLLMLCAVFPLLFDVTFAALVDYTAKTRYYLTLASPLVILLAMLSVYAWRVGLEMVADSVRRKRIAAAVLALLLGATLILQTEAARAAYRKPRRDWASLYALFREQPNSGVAYMIHLVEPGNKRPGYYSQRFYYNRSHQRPVALRLQRHLERDCNSGRYSRRRSVFLVVRYGWAQIRRLRKRLEADLPGLKVHVFHGTSVIELHRDARDEQALVRVFETLVKRLPHEAESYNAHQALAELKLCQGDFAGARAAARKLQELSPRALGKPTQTLLSKIKRKKLAAKRAKLSKRTKNSHEVIPPKGRGTSDQLRTSAAEKAASSRARSSRSTSLVTM